MDKELCSKAIAYYDEAIRAISSPLQPYDGHSRGIWETSIHRHLNLLKVERDFFIQELWHQTKNPKGPKPHTFRVN